MNFAQTLFDRAITWSPVLLLGGLAALTYWLDAQVQPPPPRIDGSSRHDPDLFVEDFRGTSFDAQGRLNQSLAARRAEHFPDDDSMGLSGLALTITEAGTPTLTVQADRGKVTGDRETLLLEGSVRATRAAAPATRTTQAVSEVNVTTEALRVVPRKQYAVTDRPVTIEEARGIIQSVGIEVDNQAKTIRFKSAVRGTISPDRASK
jgi:lipopolysaccharide export system protein LptC